MIAKPHSLISPTAKVVALMRAKSDIPYSAQIAEMCEAEGTVKEMLGDDGMQIAVILGAFVELRFKSVSEAVRRFGTKNILELACGVNPRGLIFTEDPEVDYTETDLPEMLDEKFAIVRDLLPEMRPNLHYRALNALDRVNFASAFRHIEDPVTIVHEGLLPYFSPEEQSQLAAIILDLLKGTGGVWITPDIHTRDNLAAMLKANPKTRFVIESFTGLVGRDIMANCFEDEAAAERFFRSSGFSVERHRALDLSPDLSLPTEDSMRERLKGREVWVMKPE